MEAPIMRRFTGVDIISDRIADEITILARRYQLENQTLRGQIYWCAEGLVYETTKSHLKGLAMAMKQGTIIDSTLIAGATLPRTSTASEILRF